MNCRAPPSAWPPPYLAIDAAQLPPLPVAANPTLEFRWARHKTYYMDRDGQNDLDAAHRSNLRLEWRGDAMLRWAISDAISELLPYTPLADLSVSYTLSGVPCAFAHAAVASDSTSVNTLTATARLPISRTCTSSTNNS